MISRLSEFKRLLHLRPLSSRAALLLGPRKSGKTTLLHQQFKNAKYYDLLLTDLRTSLTIRPAILREEILSKKPNIVIIDEIQKVSSLLDEIHWCLENTKTKFVLCGSSARKLKGVSGGILGGRAHRFELFPLTSKEIGAIDLNRALNHGLIPSHYLAKNVEKDLRSYVLDYLEEEIRQESIVRNLPSFSRFLEVAALMNGELLNFTNVGRDCGASPKTVREYYKILEDTLLGYMLEPWIQARERRPIETAKFYLFDTGVCRYLKKLSEFQPRTMEFGNAFETFLLNEVRSFLSYKEKNKSLFFWRTSSGQEVDLIIGNPRKAETALEFKSADFVQNKHLKSLRIFAEEFSPNRKLVISLDRTRRKTEDGLEILPWNIFCNELWNGKII